MFNRLEACILHGAINVEGNLNSLKAARKYGQDTRGVMRGALSAPIKSTKSSGYAVN